MNLPEFEKVPDAVAIDLDGTLLDKQRRVSDRNNAAIQKCVAFGIPVIIATSRAARSARRLVGDELSEICSFVTLNGAVIDGSPPLSGYFREVLPVEIIRGIIEYTLKIEPEATVGIELDGYKFGTNWDIDEATLWELNSATPDMLLSLEEALELEPSKLTIGGKSASIPVLAAVLRERYGKSISIVHSFFDIPMLMITTAWATKTNALRKLLDSGGILLNNVVAIGDDFPDLEMLQECGIPVAMANAVPEIKAVCRYETGSNDEDGVAVVLEKVVEAAGR